ncbi:hypothetical protein K8I28_04085 [bacterium]|nr:hypothetical protein [bacterium]
MRKLQSIYMQCFVLLVFMIFSGSFIGCETFSDDIPSDAPVTVNGLIEEGWTYYEVNNFERAVTSFNDASNAEATNLEAYLGMGYSFAQMNQLTRAQQNLGNVIALAPVLVDEGGLSEAQAQVLRAEAYAGMAVAFLAAKDYENAVSRAEMCMEIDPQFSHRWIEDFDDADLIILKAEAYFGVQDYANCMFALDALSGNFISNSAQLGTRTDTLVVTMLEDTQFTGIAELHLSITNLVYPSAITNLSLGSDLLSNSSFDSWTSGSLNDWSVSNTEAGVREISEVDSLESYGGSGTGACNFYNLPLDNSDFGVPFGISQTVLPNNAFVRVQVNVSTWLNGELYIENGGMQRGVVNDLGVFTFDFETASDPTLTISSNDTTNMTIDWSFATSFADGFSQEVVEYVSGGNVVTFHSVPVPRHRGRFVVDYMYANDFGEFLIELRDAIDSL